MSTQTQTKFDELFWPTGELDDEGEPIYEMGDDGAALLLIDSVLAHNDKTEINHRVVALFNQWIAIAKQRGVSGMTLDRLKSATRKKKPINSILADIRRANNKCGFLEIMNG